ncbi:prostate stem cell antigen-like [Colossoma macropomum]|uniref:prostate stem cell antigen-like n=1 Tax=Colossoma macropomum TaxID=42526 RepID=UPI0018645209|nr:prostate stem cell antigen-like [Colossoma macropomum]
MKPLVTLVLIYMLLSEAFQTSMALKCYACVSVVCTTQQCKADADRCYTATVSTVGVEVTEKGCANKTMCDEAASSWMPTCCNTDLCNSAEGVKLSLLIMLVPLISSILFI